MSVHHPSLMGKSPFMQTGCILHDCLMQYEFFLNSVGKFIYILELQCIHMLESISILPFSPTVAVKKQSNILLVRVLWPGQCWQTTELTGQLQGKYLCTSMNFSQFATTILRIPVKGSGCSGIFLLPLHIFIVEVLKKILFINICVMVSTMCKLTSFFKAG